MTVESRYKGGWKYVQDDCMLCEMETKDFVIAEKLQGGPFIVSKHHEEELSEDRRERAERLVGLLYDDFDLQVLMHRCPNHWHTHVVEEGTTRDLKDE